MSAGKQGGKHQFEDPLRVLLRQRQVSNKVDFLYVCLKNAIFVWEPSEYMCLVINGSNMYSSDNGSKIGLNLWSRSFLPYKCIDRRLLPVS